MTDPIADMISRIRNAMAVGQSKVVLPSSKTKEQVAKVLVASGFLSDVKVSTGDKFKELEIVINEDGQSSRITSIKRLSRPGQRRYVKAGNIPKVRRGRGMVVVSTSQGIMAGDDAKAKKLGGELVCEVY